MWSKKERSVAHSILSDAVKGVGEQRRVYRLIDMGDIALHLRVRMTDEEDAQVPDARRELERRPNQKLGLSTAVGAAIRAGR